MKIHLDYHMFVSEIVHGIDLVVFPIFDSSWICQVSNVVFFSLQPCKGGKKVFLIYQKHDIWVYNVPTSLFFFISHGTVENDCSEKAS